MLPYYGIRRKLLRFSLYTLAFGGTFLLGYGCGKRYNLEEKVTSAVIIPLRENVGKPIVERTISYISGRRFSEEVGETGEVEVGGK